MGLTWCTIGIVDLKVTRITGIRKTGSFAIKPAGYSKPFNASYKNCQIVHHSDGYDYALGEAFASA